MNNDRAYDPTITSTRTSDYHTIYYRDVMGNVRTHAVRNYYASHNIAASNLADMCRNGFFSRSETYDYFVAPAAIIGADINKLTEQGDNNV